jgi:hypothetical protein
MTNTLQRMVRGKMPLTENVTRKLFDRNGKQKQLFQLNKLGEATMRLFRRFVNPIENTYDAQGFVTGSAVKTGWFNKIAAYGPTSTIFGAWVWEQKGSNLVTNAGAAGVASRINGSGAEAAFTYIAIGTGTNAAAAADTTLQTEITTNGGQRASATASRVTTDVTNDTARLVVTFTFTGPFAVTESGVLNASSSGVLLNRQVFSAVNVVSGDSLQVTHNFDVD